MEPIEEQLAKVSVKDEISPEENPSNISEKDELSIDHESDFVKMSTIKTELPTMKEKEPPRNILLNDGQSMETVQTSMNNKISVKEEIPNKKEEPETKDRISSEADDDSSDKEKFMILIQKARQNAEAGNITRALRLNRRALAIHYSEKLERRIKKMEAFLEEENDSEEEEGNSSMIELGQGFLLHKTMHRKLYAHQKEGVLWMWSLHVKGKGGILADDMGLGKTIQVIAFLSGLMDMGKVKCVMIVMPLSLMPVWCNEFDKWTPGINVLQFHGGSAKERERALLRIRSRGGVLLTTYGLIMTQHDTLSTRHGREFVWDYVILDEGHKIKNQTKTSKAINDIPAKMRLILTGTPVQNNLKELWALFDYVHQGALLGTLRTFKMQFDTPITRARERDASSVAKRLGEQMSDTLKGIIQPFFLRRTKADVKASEGEQEPREDIAQMPTMMRKNDLVIWLFLSEVQQKIYSDFIQLDDVKALLMTKKSPLVALTVLKKICDHPRLLSTRACLKLGLNGKDFDEDELERESSYESAVNQINSIADNVLIEESGKMVVLIDLLKQFKAEGHKTLVFSQSRKLLDIIEKVLTNKGHKVARLDGTISHTSEREEIVSRFQKDKSYTVFLLTIQVGGVGLTITAADRVIIYDPSWNPAVDAQAVDRAYRIGQEKNVVVYRLITCGTVEEKIYRRQVFKDSITQQTTGNSKNPYRYFTKMELRELFQLDDPMTSKTQRQLQDMHSSQRITDCDLDQHLAFLHSLDIFGISDHDLMFKNTTVRDDEMDEGYEFAGMAEKNNDHGFIQAKVHHAQSLIAQESNNNFTYDQRSKGTWTQPSASRIPNYDDWRMQGGNDSEMPKVEAGGEESRPATSSLFSTDTEAYRSQPVTVLSSDSEDSSSEHATGGSTSDNDPSADNLENMVADDDLPKESPSKLASFLDKRSEIDRRVLQPLSSEEVKQRSPLVDIGKKSGPIVKEELFISPDVKRPLLGLSRDQHLVQSLNRENGDDSKSRSFPQRLFSSPSNSPGKNSPSRGGESFLSPAKSCESDSSEHVILVEESSDDEGGSPDSFASGDRSTFSPASACRKLSFVAVPNSAENSVVDLEASLSEKLGQSSLVQSSASFLATHSTDDIENSILESEDGDNIQNKENDENAEKENSERDVMREEDNDDTIGKENDDVMSNEENDEVNDKENNVMRDEDESAMNGDGENNDFEGYSEEENDENERAGVSDDNDDEADNIDDVGDSDDAGDEEALFQDLVSVARSLYRAKNYEDSLQYVEKALTIYPEPELHAMANKIKERIAQKSL